MLVLASPGLWVDVSILLSVSMTVTPTHPTQHCWWCGERVVVVRSGMTGGCLEWMHSIGGRWGRVYPAHIILCRTDICNILKEVLAYMYIQPWVVPISYAKNSILVAIFWWKMLLPNTWVGFHWRHANKPCIARINMMVGTFEYPVCTLSWTCNVITTFCSWIPWPNIMYCVVRLSSMYR